MGQKMKMKIRKSKFGIDIWNKKEDGWHVYTIYFNPFLWLKNYIWLQINDAFIRYEKKNGKETK